MAKKISELQGADLDRWVANAHGMMLYTPDWQPSRRWEQGGPLIEREGIKTCVRLIDANRPLAWAAQAMNGGWYSYGDTLLEAAMRCYVASKFGDEVDDEG